MVAMHCVVCSVNIVACLFFMFTLASAVFASARVEHQLMEATLSFVLHTEF